MPIIVAKRRHMMLSMLCDKWQIVSLTRVGTLYMTEDTTKRPAICTASGHAFYTMTLTRAGACKSSANGLAGMRQGRVTDKWRYHW